MTLPRVRHLQARWRQTPPLPVMYAIQHKMYKPDKPAEPKTTAKELLAMLKAAGGTIRG